MGLRQGIKQLDSIVVRAKPGKNVTQEQYDLILSTLKLARNMQKLRCGSVIITNAILISLISSFVIKYGYDFDLGMKIQICLVPTTVAGLGVRHMLHNKLKRKMAEADIQIKRLHDINMSQMFR